MGPCDRGNPCRAETGSARAAGRAGLPRSQAAGAGQPAEATGSGRGPGQGPGKAVTRRVRLRQRELKRPAILRVSGSFGFSLSRGFVRIPRRRGTTTPRLNARWELYPISAAVAIAIEPFRCLLGYDDTESGDPSINVVESLVDTVGIELDQPLKDCHADFSRRGEPLKCQPHCIMSSTFADQALDVSAICRAFRSTSTFKICAMICTNAASNNKLLSLITRKVQLLSSVCG